MLSFSIIIAVAATAAAAHILLKVGMNEVGEINANSIKWAMSHTGEFITLHALGMISFLVGTEKSAYLYVIARQERPQLSLEGRVETFSARIARNLNDIKKEYFLTPVLVIKLLIEYVFLGEGNCM